MSELGDLSRDPEVLLGDLATRSDGADSSRAVRVMTQVTTLLGSGLMHAELTATMYRVVDRGQLDRDDHGPVTRSDSA